LYKIYLKEINKKSPVSIDKLEKLMNYTFEITGKNGGEVSLVICDNNFIAELNEKYKGRIGPTNVLSFSMREGQFSDLNKEYLPLGDIVISMDKVVSEAKEFGDSIVIVFEHLFVHGLLHLLGFTHDDDNKEKEMNELTDTIIMGVK